MCGVNDCFLEPHQTEKNPGPGCFRLGPCIHCDMSIVEGSQLHCHELMNSLVEVTPQFHGVVVIRENSRLLKGPAEEALSLYFQKVFDIPKSHEIYTYLHFVKLHYAFVVHYPEKDSEDGHLNPIPLIKTASICPVMTPYFNEHTGKFLPCRTDRDPGVVCCQAVCQHCRESHLRLFHRVKDTSTVALMLKEFKDGIIDALEYAKDKVEKKRKRDRTGRMPKSTPGYKKIQNPRRLNEEALLH